MAGGQAVECVGEKRARADGRVRGHAKRARAAACGRALDAVELAHVRVTPRHVGNGECVVFNVTEFTYSCVTRWAEGSAVGQATVLNVIGRGRDGHTCVVVVDDVVQPHFYVECPPSWNGVHVEEFKTWLDTLARASARGKHAGIPSVTSCGIVDNHVSICGSGMPGAGSRMIKVFVTNPRTIFTLRNKLRFLKPVGDNEVTQCAWREPEVLDCLTSVYNTVDYTLVARVHAGLNYGKWYKFRYAQSGHKRRFGHADIETHVRDASVLVPVETSDVPELRVCAFDCEMFDVKSTGEANVMPSAANEDHVIGCISACWTVGAGTPDARNCANFVLGDVDDTDTDHGCVYCFRTEADMLHAFVSWLRHGSFDVVSGWNSNGFDTPYLVKRAKMLGVECTVGLVCGQTLECEEKVFASKQAGQRANSQVTGCDGVQFIDAMVMVMANFKLNSYSLDNVADTYGLGHKHEMDYSIIPVLMKSTSGRASIVRYCARDAFLVLQLGNTLRLWVQLQAKSSFIGLNMGMCAGQTGSRTIVIAAYYQEVHQQALDNPDAARVLLPWVPFGAAETTHYEGAIVLEPHKGYYANPTVVLDYRALYPSIMMDGRFCPQTLVKDGYAAAVRAREHLAVAGIASEVVAVHDLDADGADVVRPDDVAFLVVEGVDPVTTVLLKKYMAWRTQYKRERDTHPVESPAWFLLEHTQLSVKVVMNSFYGCMGSNIFWDANQIAAAITKRGRNVILHTKRVVEELSGAYRDRGVAAAETVYGDTDSVMVHLVPLPGRVIDQEDAYDVGEDMSARITRALFGPESCMLLEFEKVFLNFLLAGKKKYAAKRLEGRGDKRVFKNQFKGWVRRDKVPLVDTVQKAIMACLIDMEGGDRDARVLAVARIVAKAVEDLKAGKTPLWQLTLTCSINKPLDAYPDSLGHIRYAKRLRASGVCIVPGQRLRYVYGLQNRGDLQRESERGSLRTQKQFVGDYFERPEAVYADPANPLPLNVTKYITELQSTVRQIMGVLLGTNQRVDEVCFPPALVHTRRTHRVNPGSPLFSMLSTTPRVRCVGCGSHAAAELCEACASPRVRRRLSAQHDDRLAELARHKTELQLKCGECMHQRAEPLEDADFTCVSPSCKVRLQRMQCNAWLHQCARDKGVVDVEDMC